MHQTVTTGSETNFNPRLQSENTKFQVENLATRDFQHAQSLLKVGHAELLKNENLQIFKT